MSDFRGEALRAVETAIRPEINLGDDLADVIEAAVSALAGRPELGIYVRGNRLVRITDDDARRLRWLTRPAGSPTIAPVSVPWLTEQLDRVAVWLKPTGKGPKRVHPPATIASHVAGRLEWPALRPLEGIVEAPAFLPDGSVLDEPGYHADTGLFYEAAEAFPDVPPCPTIEDARAALARLREPLCDFPFATEADLSVVLAAVLSLLARAAFIGPAPAFAFRSPTPGSGKSLLGDVVSIITTGRVAPRMPPPNDDTEASKRILALALEGARLVLVDNIAGAFGSASLAAAFTADTWRDRVLGESRTGTAPLRVTWLLTGNNATFRGDVGRRVLPCDIDPGVEFPEDRADFRFPNLLEHVRQTRGALVKAGLTVLRAFHEAGRPGHGTPAKGSFEEWDGLVRAALIWAGAADPLGTVERIRVEGDDDREALAAGLHALRERFPFGQEFRAADAVHAAQTSEDLREALCSLAGCTAAKLDARRLGHALRRSVGRPVDALVIRRFGADRHSKTVDWRVEDAGNA